MHPYVWSQSQPVGQSQPLLQSQPEAIISMTTQNYNHPAYLNIPFFVLQDERLDFFPKLLFSFLWGFSTAGKKIMASNGYLATLFKVTERHVRDCLHKLENLKLISRYELNNKRYIKVLYVLNDDLEFESEEEKESDDPSGSQDHHNKVEGGTTVPGGEEVAFRGGGSSLPPYIKDYNKEDNNKTPKDVSSEKSFLMTLEKMLEDNPHEIESDMISEWLITRKKKKAPVTRTAWNRTNKVLTRLVESGLTAIDCFERMVASGWQGLEFRFFEQELNKPAMKYIPKEDRAAEYERIAAREREAEERKKVEIEASKGFQNIVDQARKYVDMKDLQAKQDAERIKLGMTAMEYHSHIIRGYK